jgi:hypothetical protein
VNIGAVGCTVVVESTTVAATTATLLLDAAEEAANESALELEELATVALFTPEALSVAVEDLVVVSTVAGGADSLARLAFFLSCARYRYCCILLMSGSTTLILHLPKTLLLKFLANVFAT